MNPNDNWTSRVSNPRIAATENINSKIALKIVAKGNMNPKGGAYIGMQHDNQGQVENTVYRIISGGATTDLSGGNTYGLVFKGGTNPEWGYAGVQFVDSPNTTSQVTYTWYSRSEGGQLVTPRHTGSTIGIQLFEIAA